MTPVAHYLASWGVASVSPFERRDRAAVTFAGVAPDLDGLGFLAEYATRGSDHPLRWYTDYHHVFAHNLFFALVAAAVCFAVARRRVRTALTAFGVVHLHLVFDLVASGGPDGSIWEIYYLWPVMPGWELAWSGQIGLYSTPNIVFALAMFAGASYAAWRWGRSPLDVVSTRANDAVVDALRRRFPHWDRGGRGHGGHGGPDAS